jgi:hypothetical protein
LTASSKANWPMETEATFAKAAISAKRKKINQQQ